jgi:predicted phage gp36 major capsid-like protein
MRKFILSALQRVADRPGPSGYAARDVQSCSIVATGTLTAAPRSLAVYAENPAVKDFAMRKFSSAEEIEDARPLVQLERQRLDQYVQLERQRLDQYMQLERQQLDLIDQHLNDQLAKLAQSKRTSADDEDGREASARAGRPRCTAEHASTTHWQSPGTATYRQRARAGCSGGTRTPRFCPPGT